MRGGSQLVEAQKASLRAALAEAAELFAAAGSDMERAAADQRVDAVAGELAALVVGAGTGAEWERHREWFAQSAVDRALS